VEEEGDHSHQKGASTKKNSAFTREYRETRKRRVKNVAGALTKDWNWLGNRGPERRTEAQGKNPQKRRNRVSKERKTTVLGQKTGDTRV